MKPSVLTAIVGALITTIGGIVVAYMQFHQPPTSDKIFSATGYVRDARTHKPVEGASVVIDFNGSEIQMSTDDGGYYQFKLKSGDPTVEIRRKISSPGYVTQDQTASIPLGSQGDLLLVPTAAPVDPGRKTTVSETSANAFTGLWVNANARTSGITQLSVNERGNQLLVHAWGKCEPKDCDWGMQPGAFEGQGVSINWNQGFVNRKMTLTKRGGAILVSTLDSVFTDGRPPQHSSETFNHSR